MPTIRKRSLDPGFWDDPDIARLQPLDRLLCVGIISLSDDWGNLLADEFYLKKKLFGYDDISLEEVAAMRDRIFEQCRNFIRYEVDGQTYVHLANWEKHQILRYRAHPSWPLAPGQVAEKTGWQDKKGEAPPPEERQDSAVANGHIGATLPQDSPIREEKISEEKGDSPQPPEGGDELFPNKPSEPSPKRTRAERDAAVFAASTGAARRSAPVDQTWRNVNDPRVSQYLTEWCRLFARSPPRDKKSRESWISETYAIMDALDDLDLALDLTRRFATGMAHGDKSCQFDVYSPRSLHKWLLKARDERKRDGAAPTSTEPHWGADGSNPYGAMSAEEFNAAGTRGDG